MEWRTSKVMSVLLLLQLCVVGVNAQLKNNSLIKVNYESLVSKADLNYTTPVIRGEEGMPVGNGSMGSLVWTTPDAIRFQINRVDVFAMGNNTSSFRDGHTNYANGCGYLDIKMVDYGDDVFTGNAFNQHLSVYEGLTTIKGKGVNSRVIAWSDGDVIATEIDDQRANPSSIHIDLRMLRYAINFIEGENWNLTSNNAIQIKQHEHTSTSRFEIVDGKIVLIQEFVEGDYYNASAVAVGVVGRDSKAVFYNEATARLSAKPGPGKFIVLTSSASSFDPKEDIVKKALAQMDRAQREGFDGLVQGNRAWWGDFWKNSFVNLSSSDGVADEVSKNFAYYLYVMASCSRGDYMPGFRGMLWYTNGDLAMWGSQYWWNNNGTYYNGFTPVNQPQLVEPMFKTFSNHYDAYATAARQQWGSKGIWIPETTWFNGPETMPEDIAAEMRDLYLARKPWNERSKAFMDYAETKNDLNSRWNFLFLRRSFKTGEDGTGPFAWTSHIMSSTAKIAYVYWLNYAYHLDKDWLAQTGYPVIKGVVEFYCNFPNLVKEEDGKYHLQYVNNLESSWGGKDTPEELLAMRAMIPIAIRCSEILGIDADKRPVWKEVLDNLTPSPTNSAIAAEYYDYCNLGLKDSELFKTTFEAYRRRNPGADENTTVRVLSRTGVAAANLGLADDVKYMIPAQIRSTKQDNCDIEGSGESGLGVLRNRLMLREGPGAIECERLGLASQALTAALLQSVPPTPGGDPINYIFPAWPKEWNAQFTLAARNAFLISASMQDGRIEFVEVQSGKGGKCLVENPWDSGVTVYRNGKKAGDISGKTLNLSSKTGESIVLVPKGASFPAKTVR